MWRLRPCPSQRRSPPGGCATCCAYRPVVAWVSSATDGVEVLSDVVLNQVLVRFDDDDEATNAVIERAQENGTCWLSGSSFRGRAVMRVSIVGWQTTADDVERSA
jgi:hypothetical protein